MRRNCALENKAYDQGYLSKSVKNTPTSALQVVG